MQGRRDTEKSRLIDINIKCLSLKTDHADLRQTSQLFLSGVKSARPLRHQRSSEHFVPGRSGGARRDGILPDGDAGGPDTPPPDPRYTAGTAECFGAGRGLEAVI